MSLSKEQLSRKPHKIVEDFHLSMEYTGRLDDISEVSLNEELDCVSEKILEHSHLTVLSGDKVK